MVTHGALRAQPEAPARPAGDEGTGAGHRDGRRRRRGDVRDVPVELRFAAADAAAPTTSSQRFADVFASLKRAPLRVGRPTLPRFPASSAIETRVVADVTLDLRRPRRAGERPADLDSGEPAAARQRPLPPARPLDRAGPPRRGARQRRRSSSPTRLEPGDQVRRVINGRLRRLTIVGVALSPEYIYSIRPGEIVPDDQRFGDLLDGRAGAGGGLRHGRRLQRRRAGAVARRVDRRRRSRGSTGCSSRTAASARFRARCSSRTGRSRTSWRSCRRFGFMLPLIFLMRRGLHPQRRADARAGAAAAADRRAQGARLRQRRARLALPEMGAR